MSVLDLLQHVAREHPHLQMRLVPTEDKGTVVQYHCAACGAVSTEIAIKKSIDFTQTLSAYTDLHAHRAHSRAN